MSIRLKILLGCLVMLCVTGGFGLSARRQATILGSLAINAYEQSVISISYSRRAQVEFVRLASEPADVGANVAEARRRTGIKDVLDDLSVAITRIKTPITLGLATSLRNQIESPVSAMDFTDIGDRFDTLVETLTADAFIQRGAVDAMAERGKHSILIALGASIVSAILITVLLGSIIVRPLRRAVAFASSVAEGKLDNVLLSRSGDEIGQLIRALTHMQSSIVDNIAQMEVQRAAEERYRLRAIQHENELARERQRVAEETSRAKSAFLAMMSHEIRTPMNGVLGLTDALLNDALTSGQRETVETIRDSGQSLLRILNDILDFSKLDANKMTFENAPFSPAALTDGIASIMRTRANDRGLRLMVSTAQNLPAAMLGDAGRIRQALINLVSNAMKFTQSGEVEITLRCPSRTASTATLEWTVRDTGIGIAPERIGHLFTEFTQADTSIARRFGGTGLGLAISKRIVEQMGGTIGVTSLLGSGTTFRIAIPLAVTVFANEPAPVRGGDGGWEEICHALGRTPRILVAEDDATNRMVVRRLLETIDLRLDMVCNGQEAVEAAAATAYDAIFMDMQMPEMDGVTATKLIRGRGGELAAVPIVALTANAFPEDIKACLDSGMNRLITKPVNRKVLVDTLTAVLSERLPTMAAAL